MTRLAPIIAGLIALCLLQAAPVRAQPSQFTHTGWTGKDGVPGMAQALAQTPDGYMWVGTYEGLFRFDGVSFERMATAPGHPAGSIPVSALHVTAKGELWVGFAGGAGVEILRNGRMVRGGMPNAPGDISVMDDDLDGSVWVVGGRGWRAFKRYRDGRWETIDGKWGVPEDEAISSVFVDRDGIVWLATDSRLLFLRRGAKRFEATGLRLTSGASMAEDAAGNLWISDQTGTWMLPEYDRGDRRPRASTFHRALGSARRTSILFDRQGHLWGTTYTGGVFRITSPGTPGAERLLYGTRDGLTSNQAVSIMQDREGNVWVATELGLDQFRRANVERVPLPPQSSAFGYLMAADDRGDVYIASGSVLYRAEPGQELKAVRTGIQSQALCPGKGGIMWQVLRDRVLGLKTGRTITSIPLPGRQLVSGCAETDGGQLWLSTLEGTILARQGGGWRTITLPSGTRGPRNILMPWGNRLVGTLGRTSLVIADRGRMRSFANKVVGVAGLTTVHGTPRGLLIGGGTALALWDGHRFRRLSIEQHPWLRGVRGIAERDGQTWMINNQGIIRVATADLNRAFDQPTRPIAHDLFDEQDGFTSRTQNTDGLQLTAGGDGRLWFLTRQGVLRVDPAALHRNGVPPPVAIRGLTADGQRYADPTAIDLPAGTRNLSIDYTGLSLTVPSRVRFRYKLDGVDGDWVDPGTRRQAFYTNLSPGDYRFQVVAANNDGVWNRKGATLAFTIKPTFVQTPFFALLCLLAVGALLWLAYHLRMRTLTRRMDTRMAERLAERERIARELHDTLLQGVQALVLRFQLAADDISPDQPTRHALEQALDRADQVLAEGRDRVRSLRVGDTGDNLEQVIQDVVQRHAFGPNIRVHLETQGEPRPLNPLVFDEMSRIANEALFNIWRHAQASRVEVEIMFRPANFAIRFRDNGVGIGADILEAGMREDHFGLVGMRERASKMQGELSVRSVPGIGTEIAVTVPAPVAYARVNRLRALFGAQRRKENV